MFSRMEQFSQNRQIRQWISFRKTLNVCNAKNLPCNGFFLNAIPFDHVVIQIGFKGDIQ